MLEMRIRTKEDILEMLSGSGIKRVVAKEVHNSNDLDEIIKSAKTISRTAEKFTVFLVAS